MVGTQAPAFDMQGLEANQRIDLDDFAGNIVLLDFWATYCAPCRASLPKLDELAEEFELDGVSIVAVNVDGPIPNARVTLTRFAEEIGLSQDIIIDNGRMSQLYRVTNIPHAVLIDRDGNISRVYTGGSEQPHIRAGIRALVNGTAP